MSFPRISIAVGFAALANTVIAGMAGTDVRFFPPKTGKGCDISKSPYFEFTVSDGYPSCSGQYFGANNFPQNSEGQYEGYVLIPTPEENCAYFIRAPADVTKPECGEVILSVDNANVGEQCLKFTMPDPFDLNFCCGSQDCNAALSNANKVKRNETITRIEPRKPVPFSDGGDNAVQLKPRSSCSWAASRGVYSKPGASQKVTGQVSCDSTKSCHDHVAASVTKSSSQTFEVSESTEVGLFDIVSETVSFSYSYTWEQSTEVTETVDYTIPPGATGYISFTPYLECTDGQFHGPDCSKKGVPTATSGTVCVPSTIDNSEGGLPYGESLFVQSA